MGKINNSFSTLFNEGIGSFFRKLIYGRVKNTYSLEDPNVIPEPSKTFTDKDYMNKRIAVYTCITGSYDDIKEPQFVNKNVDYFIFTNNENLKPVIWKKKDIPEKLKGLSNANINRYIKMHPNELFSDYDYVIYVDGSILIAKDIVHFIPQINPEVGMAGHRHALRNCFYKESKVCITTKRGNYKAIKKQRKYYKKQGFPKEYGLIECPVLYTIVGDNSKKIYDGWYEEFNRSNSGRDQLSLPFVLWKNGIKTEDVARLGTNVICSDTFVIKKHS